jgi:hypothetical protein
MVTAQPECVSRGSAPTAVVWINARLAVVAVAHDDGERTICTQKVDRHIETETEFVGRVVAAVGDTERVMVVGPNHARLALERAYVAIYQRPDRIIDVERVGPLDSRELVAALGA